MAQVVGRKAITHDYAMISSIICNHILLHVLCLYSNEQSPETLSLYSTNTLSCPLMYVCSSSSRRGRNSVNMYQSYQFHRYGSLASFALRSLSTQVESRNQITMAHRYLAYQSHIRHVVVRIKCSRNSEFNESVLNRSSKAQEKQRQIQED
jgi:hypothetical protein